MCSNRAAGMNHWRSHIELSHPFWEDYRDGLLKLDGESFPSAEKLNDLLPAGLGNRNGRTICFVSSDQLPAVDYENHIFHTGEVSTRKNSWHDLFNALVWARFPKLKVAMNAVHQRELNSGCVGSRGKQRDALTLFDESGAIIVSSDKDHLNALSGRDWNSVFQKKASAWQDEIKIFLVGHALLEKFPRPYKSVAAQTLLMHLDSGLFEQPRSKLLQVLDKMLAEHLLADRILESPASLSPLPLMGIPGWWKLQEQNEGFYADQQVFRPAHENGSKAPIYSLNSGKFENMV